MRMSVKKIFPTLLLGLTAPADALIVHDEGFASSRRTFLSFLSGTSSALVLSNIHNNQAVLAREDEEEGRQDDYSGQATRRQRDKPFAPTQALLPATRAKLWVEECHQLSAKLEQKSNGESIPLAEQTRTLEELRSVLAKRPKLFVNERPLSRVSSTALAQFSGGSAISGSTGSSYQRPMDEAAAMTTMNGNQLAGLGSMFSSALNQADVSRQYGMLQAQESRRESQNELRAAFNYYTQQLEFNGVAYQWTSSAEEKKYRIRNDSVPTPQAVITSDLDLRDLYRNQLLTALDDVIAEVDYQIKGIGETPGNLDTSDVVDLMNQAYTALNKWFGLIDPLDRMEAEEAIKRISTL